MSELSKQQPCGAAKIPGWIAFAFLIPLLYWLYLFSITEMVVAHDALGYERLGALINSDGILAYFQNGPNREPLYPLLIALSMRIADGLSVSYQTVQMFLQIILLVLTQFLTLRLLSALNIRPPVIFLTLLYLGISPSVVNSGFRLYSEVLAYPLVLAFILLSVRTAEVLEKKTDKNILVHGVVWGISGTLIVLLKAIFMLVVPLIILAGGFYQRVTNRSIKTGKILIITLTALLVFYMPIMACKLANKTFNGHFTFTDRGAFGLYGSTFRRTQPMTPDKIYAGLLMTLPRSGLCESRFAQDDCYFWTYVYSDHHGGLKLAELKNAGITDTQVDKALLFASAKMVGQKPLQYLFLCGLEALKMFFWETQGKQYLHYPARLSTVLDSPLISVAIYKVWPSLSLAGLLYAFIFIFRKKNLAQETPAALQQRWGIFNICSFIIISIMAHSFFYILDRYSFALIPFYLILIAFCLENVLRKLRAGRTT